ncbi:MAG: PLP-dependent transferase [Nonlabens sp.]|nr:PLP-dependent transferase [Nonlabens sp.]
MTNNTRLLDFTKQLLANMPSGWLGITTHRLDIYNEDLAKTEFLVELDKLYQDGNAQQESLEALPTAYDYIRLGHPLSCVLEWVLAQLNQVTPDKVICFSSETIALLAVLRTNKLANKKTRILYTGEMPSTFDANVVLDVYRYDFDLVHVVDLENLAPFDGSTIYISQPLDLSSFDTASAAGTIDFVIHVHEQLGSILLINGTKNSDYIAPIQHVRRRETIAMTPINCLAALHAVIGKPFIDASVAHKASHKAQVLNLIKDITGTTSQPLVGSSGLSIQYAIMMGLIHDAQLNHPGKAIKFIVPPNCYGGTNDQARRVAACLENVAIVDLPVDGDSDMVQSIETVLTQLAAQDAIPYIIAEIPTNPRVEVPDLDALKAALTKERFTPAGTKAIDPVFILDQTFCPNVLFLGEGKTLEAVRTISYASGSKFPSGGKCTAGYCVGNNKTEGLLEKIALHLTLCDNEATALQYEFLAQQLPSMNTRIAAAYENTREFVSYIQKTLPEAKINFVSEELAAAGFTPSVFSLDLPTKGNTPQEKEKHKRELNLKLIHLMIDMIPDESKFCVSYGQLKGCYWTVPATSTQGTTKEGDKDYIVRASLSPDLNLVKHKAVFQVFVDEYLR